MTTPPDPTSSPGISSSPAENAAPEVPAEDDAALRSGLKNPAAAVRGLGAGALILEAIILLVAIQPIRQFGGELGGFGVGVVIGLAVAAILLAGSMRRPWAWAAGTVLQVLLLASGFIHWSLSALGVIFGSAWIYALYVRRTLESAPKRGPQTR